MADSPALATGGLQERTSILKGQFLLNGTCKHALAGGFTKLKVSVYILLSSAKLDILLMNIVTEQTSLMMCPLEANSAVIETCCSIIYINLVILFHYYISK